ncbi:MAG: phosphoribosyl-ATP diphosphatase [Haloquadratum sp.]|jgi:phosphoribosyl-ATP pyrophosphohydrolase|nr:phosphoribosyl-ATP diphosphatase [Haloferacaceae archaeon]MDR9445455.1 phosphoribosyl-ATP diphosphatase [Haloquadratum sp.]
MSTSPAASFEALFETILQRQEHAPPDSYTAALLSDPKGRDAILEKIGEESTEVILAAAADRPQRTVAESADLLYHLFVLLAAMDISLAELAGELAARAD